MYMVTNYIHWLDNLKIRKENVSPHFVRYNLPAFRNTHQVHGLLILQGGLVFSSPSVVFFYYQELQGA